MNPTLGIYLINLERSPDRLKMQDEQFARLDLPFTRVEAVDGSTLSMPHPALDETGFQRRHGKTVNRNELGCTLSHLRAMEMFLSSDRDFAIILEDDAELLDGFRTVADALVACNENWDLVKLNRRHAGLPLTVTKLGTDHKLVSYLTKQSGAVGYMLNRKAARALSQNMLPMRVPFDHEFDRGHAYGLRVFGVQPPIVKDNLTIGSTIGYGYDADQTGPRRVEKPGKLPRHKRLPTYAYRSLESVRRLVTNTKNALTARSG